MSSPPARRLPNILITGTPGTGKTTHAQSLHASLSAAASVEQEWTHVNVGDWVKDKGLHEGWDEEWESWIVDDDKVLDALEPLVDKGGLILDWHSSEIFPEAWLDLILVLRCDHTKLWERLEARNYPLHKIQENNESEIFGTCLSEALEAFPGEGAVVELVSEDVGDMEGNLERVEQWVARWLEERRGEGQ